MTAAQAKDLSARRKASSPWRGAHRPGRSTRSRFDAAGTDPRVRPAPRPQRPAVPGAIMMWVVADNLRKGAALNAVQIVEKLFVG